MGILIDNRQNRLQFDLPRVTKTAQAILSDLGNPDAELSLSIVDDNEITELNRCYLQREGPTNVIAFPMQTEDFPEISPHLLGDVVISADTAEKESEMAGIRVHERFVELLIHGILHLMGYDHEQGGEEAVLMEKKSEALRLLVADLDWGTTEKTL